MASNIELAKKAYTKHNGQEHPFIEEMMATGMTLHSASAYFTSCQQDELAHHHISIAKSARKPSVEVAVKRKVIVVLEMELEDFEDTYDTASMAVGLLNSNMDNNVTLIAAHCSRQA